MRDRPDWFQRTLDGLAIAAFCLFIWGVLALISAHATTYFNPPVNTITDATTAHASDVNGNFAGIVSDGNTAISSIESAISGAGGGALTQGVIAVINTACPNGWKLADGSNGTVDLRSVFIRGLDSGAGRDPGRALASYQADAIQQHAHSAPAYQISAVTGLGVGSGATMLVNPVFSSFNTGGVTNVSAGVNVTAETAPLEFIISWCMLVP